jgi:aldehyde:ferredoxin oxidoreductase
MWGMPTDEAEARLLERFGADRHSVVIGPAGENCVRYATISHGNRHAGRGGLGAVMGSKRLKAIVVSGSQRVEVADPGALAEAARDLSRRSFGPATAKYRELGTVANLLAFNRLYALPTRNFQQGTFEDADKLSGEALNEARRVVRASCAACTIGCEHVYSVGARRYGTNGTNETDDGKRSDTVRLEYESLFALGPMCGIGDHDVVLRAAQVCDRLGLDTISAGATVAFAMECAERGLVHADKLRFGNGDALLELLPRIARREGTLGRLLAEGSRRAAEIIGGDAPSFAPHVKGLELPGYEPRALQTMALGFAVASRGADHNRSGAYEADFSTRADRLRGSPESAQLAVDTEDRAALMDSLVLCKFLRGVFTDLFTESAQLLCHVTGWQVTAKELHATAQRIVTAKKLFNIREGWTVSEDTLPARFLTRGLPLRAQGEAVLTRVQLAAMVQSYYAERRWDRDGRVPAALVEEFGLTNPTEQPNVAPSF